MASEPQDSSDTALVIMDSPDEKKQLRIEIKGAHGEGHFNFVG